MGRGDADVTARMFTWKESVVKWLVKHERPVKREVSKAARAELRRWFELLDEDGGGSISVLELSNALRFSGDARDLASKFAALHELVALSRKRKKKRKSSRSSSKTRKSGRKSMGRRKTARRGELKAAAAAVAPTGVEVDADGVRRLVAMRPSAALHTAVKMHAWARRAKKKNAGKKKS